MCSLRCRGIPTTPLPAVADLRRRRPARGGDDRTAPRRAARHPGRRPDGPAAADGHPLPTRPGASGVAGGAARRGGAGGGATRAGSSGWSLRSDSWAFCWPSTTRTWPASAVSSVPVRPLRAAATENVTRRLWHWLPWLLVGLAGALAAAVIVGAFEHQLEEQVLLAFFVPGVVHLADAVGADRGAGHPRAVGRCGDRPPRVAGSRHGRPAGCSSPPSAIRPSRCLLGSAPTSRPRSGDRVVRRLVGRHPHRRRRCPGRCTGSAGTRPSAPGRWPPSSRISLSIVIYFLAATALVG